MQEYCAVVMYFLVAEYRVDRRYVDVNHISYHIQFSRYSHIKRIGDGVSISPFFHYFTLIEP